VDSTTLIITNNMSVAINTSFTCNAQLNYTSAAAWAAISNVQAQAFIPESDKAFGPSKARASTGKKDPGLEG
jgi:hypothetical protein